MKGSLLIDSSSKKMNESLEISYIVKYWYKYVIAFKMNKINSKGKAEESWGIPAEKKSAKPSTEEK